MRHFERHEAFIVLSDVSSDNCIACVTALSLARFIVRDAFHQSVLKHKSDKVAAGSQHDGVQNGHPNNHDANNQPSPSREIEWGLHTAQKLLHVGVDVVAHCK